MNTTFNHKPTLFTDNDEDAPLSAYWELKITEGGLATLFSHFKRLAMWHIPPAYQKRAIRSAIIDRIAMHIASECKTRLEDRISDAVADLGTTEPSDALAIYAPEIMAEFEAEVFEVKEDGRPSRFLEWLNREAPAYSQEK